MMITTTQAHTFMRKGDKPMDRMERTTAARSRYTPAVKWTVLSFLQKWATIQVRATHCEQTVARAAPRIPQ